MAGRLSFSIAINLLTENFKRGTSQVKNAFRSMQAQIFTFAAALGVGGIGLSNLVTRFVEVARETSRVTTSLKNVSGSMAQYADNQKFLIELARKYGLEINNLTGAYAKFTAAASISGMSMEDQRKIFESVSRACTAFGMSADDSNSVFLALSQMMSKGKISSEELRLQMGERLPIALQAMAKAAGVSVAGLDKLLKQGKLMSADVLPKFADALNEMIPNVDTDNLETSVNRLKNTFTELVNSSGVQSSYKSLIDWLTGAIQSAAENIRNIVIGLLALITGAVANHAVKWLASVSGTASQLEAAAIRSNTALIAATANRIAAEIALEKAKVAANNATGVAALAARKQVTQAQITLTAASAAEQVEIENVKAAELKILEAKKVADAKRTAIALATITRNRIAAEIELEAAKTGVITANNTQILAAQQRLAAAQKSLAKLTAKEIAAQEAAKVAAVQAASIKSATWWGTACTTMKVAGAKLVASLNAMWRTFAPMVIVSVIIALIGKFVEMRREAERVKNIFSEYRKGAEGITHSPEIIQLQVIRDLYNKAADGSKLKEKYQNRIVELLGGELKKNQDINAAVAERIKLLEATAKVDYFTRQKIDAEEKLKSIYNKRGGEEAFNFQYNNTIENQRSTYLNLGGEPAILGEFEEALSLRKVMADAEANLYNYTEFLEKNKPQYTPITDPNGDPDNKKSELQKQEEKYAQSIRELNAKREVEKMSVDEYSKAYDDLHKNALIEAKSSDDKKVLTSQYIANLQKAVDTPLYGSVQAELAKVETEYTKATELAKSKLDRKLISEDDYRQALIDAATSAANSAISIDGIGNAADGFIKRMQGVVGDNLNIEKPKLRQRDTTFDYNKTDTDKLSENVDIWIEYRDDLKDKLAEAKKSGSDLAASLESELNGAIANVDNLKDALKIAQVRQDIKDLSQEIGEAKWDGMKSAVSNIDGMVSAFQRLKDAFDPDSEADGWERLMALWNSFTSVVDGIMSVVKVIENITELTNRLTEAKEKDVELDKGKMMVDTLVTNTEVINDVKGAASDTVAANTKKANSRGVIAANTTEAATGAAKSVAGIPIVGIALAAAAVATIIGLFASLPKFARGGIVTGGPAAGDKILARVNAGEMILNHGQQSRLFEAINSGRLGGGNSLSSTVTTKVRSKDLILTINNELKSQGKKPIS